MNKELLSNARLLLLLLLCFSIGSTFFVNKALAAELVVNGGFETGNLTGWTTEVPPQFDGGVTSTTSHSGTYCLRLGEVDFIHQAFTPSVSTTGDLSFWAKCDAGATLNPLGAIVDYSDGSSTILGFWPTVGAWSQYTLSVDHAKLVSQIRFTTWEMQFPPPIYYYIDDVSLLGPSAAISAHIFIQHTYRGDLIIDIGVGNPASPAWSKNVWNRAGGSADNLDLTVDLSAAAAYLPPTSSKRWFVKVYDAASQDQGQITEFTITHLGTTYSSKDVPVPVKDLQTSYAYIPSISTIAHIFIQHTYRGDLIVDIGVGSTSTPLWSKRVWSGTGGSADNLDLYIDLSSAVTYLPPSATYTWWVKVYDKAAGDTGKIVTFTITYQGKTYTSTDVPVPVTDLKTSYAYVPSPAQAHVYIQHTYRGDLIVDIGVGSTSAPLWSKRVWSGTGGSLDNLELYVDLSGALAYLPPSSTYTWWVKVYDKAAGDTGKIVTFTIAYQGKTYTSPNVPVPISDFKTSYAYIKG